MEKVTDNYDPADISARTEKYVLNEKGQAMPSGVLPVTPEAFGARTGTEITWLGGAGILLNVRGTVLLIDPLLTGFDMPTLFDCPLRPEDVKRLDAVLVTHIDNDHFSRETCRALADRHPAFHSTGYVAEEMRRAGVPGGRKQPGGCGSGAESLFCHGRKGPGLLCGLAERPGNPGQLSGGRAEAF